MVKNKDRHKKALSRDKKFKCGSCNKKRVLKRHLCSHLTKEDKRRIKEESKNV